MRRKQGGERWKIKEEWKEEERNTNLVWFIYILNILIFLKSPIVLEKKSKSPLHTKCTLNNPSDPDSEEQMEDSQKH